MKPQSFSITEVDANTDIETDYRVVSRSELVRVFRQFHGLGMHYTKYSGEVRRLSGYRYRWTVRAMA